MSINYVGNKSIRRFKETTTKKIACNTILRRLTIRSGEQTEINNRFLCSSRNSRRMLKMLIDGKRPNSRMTINLGACRWLRVFFLLPCPLSIQNIAALNVISFRNYECANLASVSVWVCLAYFVIIGRIPCVYFVAKLKGINANHSFNWQRESGQRYWVDSGQVSYTKVVVVSNLSAACSFFMIIYLFLSSAILLRWNNLRYKIYFPSFKIS